ncbi:SDR family oxidoreductase [Corynebacterium epidermidicanis]|uniref:Short-chain alcohol dehydrogenase n=1 Tax=Corynebacterium epidermidicanis TaxID=1050174 RepID=A0A0G3GLM6_9CORY|nr:SDR family oxidoreductase [Corynebacterium epidermidicanis]AKK02074.1 short-chain alcohol dehydrogenase [Corynebacterium epidermidicanis]
MTKKIALVTGGSSGIGAATASALAKDGWHVIVAARRVENIKEIAAEINGEWRELDVTDEAAVVALAAEIPKLDLLVNNAGGAKGLDSIADANVADWRWMYETNVLGTLNVTRAFLPHLLESEGTIINVGSIASFTPYPGGAGYNAAKFGVRAMTKVLRQELEGQPLRITQIDPGRVKTDFSLVRFKGDAEKAEAVYADKLNLTAEDIAESIRWVAGLPAHMNIENMTIKPRDQL